MLSITYSVKTRYFEIAVSETVVRVLDLEKLGYKLGTSSFLILYINVAMSCKRLL